MSSLRPDPDESALHMCALCERKVSRVTRHHLIPRSAGGRAVIDLCVPCHKTLHSLFTNSTLLRELHTLETLRAEPSVARYLSWVRRQPDAAIRVRTSRTRR